MQYTLENFINDNLSINSSANKLILEFIYDFLYLSKSKEAIETLRLQFRNGYCYYFAEILKLAFNTGTVCWAAPLGHIVWVCDNVAYDIEGVNTSDCEDYIPISYIQEALDDFKHVPNKAFNASKEFIENAMRKYRIDQSDMEENKC